MRLIVHQALARDVYKDTARIHKEQRGAAIQEGRIFRLHVNGESRLVAVRGLPDDEREYIRLDDVTRDRLHVNIEETYHFKLTQIWPWERVTWALVASDPAARIAAWLGLWSLVLGVIALVLAT